jgi:hypothetical protein
MNSRSSYGDIFADQLRVTLSLNTNIPQSTFCYSSVILSPANFPVKMSPYEREGDIERKGTETIVGSE